MLASQASAKRTGSTVGAAVVAGPSGETADTDRGRTPVCATDEVPGEGTVQGQTPQHEAPADFEHSDEEDDVSETTYVENNEAPGARVALQQGELNETLADENKSLVWPILKQLRPGMDLTRIALPTFILEPRCLLDRLGDYFFHVDELARAATEADPIQRMLGVVRWYISGFYATPKGVKKPYNPILGQTFRCCWLHPDGTRTFYIAEQVSHYPPISAFYASNRTAGYVVSGVILTHSKFFAAPPTVASVLEGSATLHLLNLNESYTITFPNVYAKGILIGTLSMELGGTPSITCAQTGLQATIEFKLKVCPRDAPVHAAPIR